MSFVFSSLRTNFVSNVARNVFCRETNSRRIDESSPSLSRFLPPSHLNEEIIRM